MAVLNEPIYNLAFDAQGRLWATTGGGPLLQLDPESGQVLASYGDAIELGLAVDPATGLLYVGTGTGVQIFDPLTHTFQSYSRDLNLRVASLAFDNDGTLWATTWPDRTQVVSFDAHAQAQVMFRFDAPVDSLAFGEAGTSLAGLLFVSHNSGPDGSELTMIDTATLQQVAVATGGSRGYVVLTTSDGRVLVSQSSQVDVLNPLTNPGVLAVNPPDESIVALPLPEITVTFDQAMVADSATDPASVTDPDNYTLVGADGQAATIVGVAYDSTTHTALLQVQGLTPQSYTLTVLPTIEGTDGFTLAGTYTTTFTAVNDVSNYAQLRITDTRLDRHDQTVTYEVTITNTADYDLLLPLILTLNPAKFVQGAPQGALEQSDDGRWIFSLEGNVPGGVRLEPGQSTTGLTVHIVTPGFETADYQPGVAGVPSLSAKPTFTSTAPTDVNAGETYHYAATATDVEGAVVAYLLQRAPLGMTVDPSTGEITWVTSSDSPAEAAVTLYAFDTRGSWEKQQWTIHVAGGNQAPELGPLPTTLQINEGESWQIPVTATDADGDPLAFWVDNVPPGAVFDPNTQILSWTPAAGQAGTYSAVTVYVSDGTTTTSQSFDILVAPSDFPPTLTLPPDRTVRQGDGFIIYFAGTDPGGGAVHYSSSDLPDGATLNPNTGQFEWTPAYDQSGDFAVPITVTGPTGLATTKTITFTVLPAAVPPVFDPQPGWTVFEGQSLVFQTFALDPNHPDFVLPTRNPDGTLNPPDPDAPVAYTISGLPDGATYDDQTATFQWIPGYDQAGQYEITVTATDTDPSQTTPLATTITIPITVRNVNRPPEITPIGNVTLDRGDVVDVPVVVTDPDGDPLVLSAVNALTNQPLPRFVTFTDLGDGQGVFHFAPGAGDRGDYSLTLVAQDDGDLDGPTAVRTSAFTFIVTVVSPNDPPVLAPINDRVSLPGDLFSVTAVASDIDQDALTFTVEGLPAEATITPGVTYGTATLNWTPTAADVGTYTVTIGVSDDGNGGAGAVLSDSQTFQLIVRITDSVPAVDQVDDATVAEGSTLSLQLSGSNSFNDPLTWSATGLPLGAALDPLSGILTWTPNFDQAGEYPVTITAGNGHLSGSTSFSIIATDVNRPPQLVAVPHQYARENTQLIFTVVGADPDGDPAQLSAENLPAGATFNTLNGVFQWTPDFTQAGDHTITFRLTDPAGLSDSIQVAIHVDNVDRAPVLAIGDHQAVLGQTLTFSAAGTDPDVGDTLHYSAVGLPEGATLDVDTGLVTWTAGPAQAGDHIVRFTASDGTRSTSQSIVLRAALQATPPTVTFVLTPSFPVAPGTTVTVHALASSVAPITGITLSLDGVPVTLDAQGRAQIVAGSPGKMLLEATATDADGLVNTGSTYLKVRDPNDATAPAVELDRFTAPLVDLTEVLGTVADTNLDSWTLQLATLGSSRYTDIASGVTPVADGPLFSIDPATLANGFYQLRLRALDISGRQSVTTTSFEVNTAAKPGAVQVTDTDLTTTLGGITVSLTRAYDSVAADAFDTFGAGWRLVNRDVGLQTDLVPTGANRWASMLRWRRGRGFI